MRTALAALLVLTAVAASAPPANANRRRPSESSCPTGYEAHANLALDQDGDGYWTGGPISVCVQPIGQGWITGSRYYRDPHGYQYIDINSANNGGGDCDDSNPRLYRLKFGALDPGHTGRYTGSIAERCVGDMSLIGDSTPRRYYDDGIAAEWLDAADAIGPQ